MRAMVVTEGKTACDRGRNGAELCFDRHADSLGSGVAIPILATCHPIASAFQWSTTANSQTLPSSTVGICVASVPHIRFGAVVIMRPSWASPCRARWRCGDSRPFSRINRSTRLRATRMPSSMRSRAHTLRCPSPIQGERSRSARMALSTAASAIAGLAPRRNRVCGGAVDPRCRRQA